LSARAYDGEGLRHLLPLPPSRLRRLSYLWLGSLSGVMVTPFPRRRRGGLTVAEAAQVDAVLDLVGDRLPACMAWVDAVSGDVTRIDRPETGSPAGWRILCRCGCADPLREEPFYRQSGASLPSLQPSSHNSRSSVCSGYGQWSRGVPSWRADSPSATKNGLKNKRASFLSAIRAPGS
jgi:hypothetical protein